MEIGKEFFEQEPESETQEFKEDKIFEKPTQVTDGNSRYIWLFAYLVIATIFVAFAISLSKVATGEARLNGPKWDVMEVICLGVIGVFLLTILGTYKFYEISRRGKGPKESVQKLGLDD